MTSYDIDIMELAREVECDGDISSGYSLPKILRACSEVNEAAQRICLAWGEPANKPGPSLDSLVDDCRVALAKLSGIRP